MTKSCTYQLSTCPQQQHRIHGELPACGGQRARSPSPRRLSADADRLDSNRQPQDLTERERAGSQGGVPARDAGGRQRPARVAESAGRAKGRDADPWVRRSTHNPCVTREDRVGVHCVALRRSTPCREVAMAEPEPEPQIVRPPHAHAALRRGLAACRCLPPRASFSRLALCLSVLVRSCRRFSHPPLSSCHTPTVVSRAPIRINVCATPAQEGVSLRSCKPLP